MMAFRELIGTLKLSAAASHISKAGALLVDTQTQQVYVQNGSTPGTLLGGSSPILQGTFPLTSAQLLASNTPIPLLAAPGAGKMYLIHQVTYYFAFKTTPYNNDASGNGVWYGTSFSADQGDLGALQGSETQLQQSMPYSLTAGVPLPMSVCENAALNFWSPNGALTGGDGSAIITIFYSILSLPQ